MLPQPQGFDSREHKQICKPEKILKEENYK